MRIFAFACCLFFCACMNLRAQEGTASREAAERVRGGVDALLPWSDSATGLYRTTGWWNAANITTVLIDSTRATGDRTLLERVAHTFTAAQRTMPGRPDDPHHITGFPGFLNKFYDDEGWWALAWIDAWDATGRPEYLAMAQSIFRDMQGGWDNTCGGGIWWSKDRTYKNAIANELFFDVSASLANRGTEADKHAAADWARKEWAWFQSTGMINDQHLVNDGLVIDRSSGACHNNGHTVWTYNQGVILGALTEWSRAIGDAQPAMEAEILADAGLLYLTDANGILHDPCEPNCGADANQFKGIFVRNLGRLNSAVHDPRYRSFFQTNADSIWTNARNEQNQFSVVWTGPMAEINAGTQASALDALVAAAANP